MGIQRRGRLWEGKRSGPIKGSQCNTWRHMVHMCREWNMLEANRVRGLYQRGLRRGERWQYLFSSVCLKILLYAHQNDSAVNENQWGHVTRHAPLRRPELLHCTFAPLVIYHSVFNDLSLFCQVENVNSMCEYTNRLTVAYTEQANSKWGIYIKVKFWSHFN